MGNHIDLDAGNLEDFLQELRGSWLITISRSESSPICSMTINWSGLGSRRTVCKVVTTGIFKPRKRCKI